MRSNGSANVSSGSSAPASAYPGQGANAVNAGSDVPAQAGQAALGAYTAQGASNAGTEAETQSSTSNAEQGAAGSGAKAGSAQHANAYKAVVPTPQGQWSASPAVRARKVDVKPVTSWPLFTTVSVLPAEIDSAC